jgi:NADPH:quinone reductase-like Zn-dependent oxidoreductase
VDDAAAVALVRSGQVALGALRAALQPGESVLVTAAAGGVGHLAVQLAKILGASRVVAAISTGSATDTKTEFLHDIGASQVVRYDQPLEQWGEPVDVVLDGAGGHVQTTSLEFLAPLGRLVSYNATGAEVDVNHLRLHAKTVIGFAMAHLASRRPDVYTRRQAELWELHHRGALRPAIHAVLPLDQAAQAHRAIITRSNVGKLVLTPKTNAALPA